MGDDALGKDEIESLLNAMDGGGGGSASPAQAAPAAAAPRQVRQRVTTYDFKRPERVGKEQMRALQTLHEGFGRNFGAALSALLRSIVDVKLTSVDQLTYNEFVFSLENPTCFNLLKAKPLEGNLILDINPSILYPIIDRLLGGGRESSSFAKRPLTEIELRLVTRITTLFLIELKNAWEKVLELDLSVERVESNPQLVQIVPPNEVVVLISFEVSIGDVRGMINLCIPFNSIERIASKLTANSWAAYGKHKTTPENTEILTRGLRGSVVELVAHLGSTAITTRDLLGLRVGDIITTKKDTRQPLTICVEGVPKFHASVGQLKGHKAIQVEDQIEAEPPISPSGSDEAAA